MISVLMYFGTHRCQRVKAYREGKAWTVGSGIDEMKAETDMDKKVERELERELERGRGRE